MSNDQRTVVLGFDALDFRYLDAFASSLPNFEELRTEGVSAPLRSTFPPWTGSAWPSMYTGCDPSTHGVYGFFHHDSGYPDEDTLVTRNHVDAPAIWNYLTRRDEPVVVLNVPVTHPADPVVGVLVPGYLAHEDETGYPEGIRETLSEAIGEEFRIYSPTEIDGDPGEKRESYLDLIRMRGKAAEHLLENYDWEIAIIQVQKTDTVFHDFADQETFRRTYERADEVLGRVRTVASDANVVVCSDHGIGPVDGYNIYLNEVLHNAGFVETATGVSRPSLVTEKPTLTGNSVSDTGESSPVEQLVSITTRTLDRAGIAPGDAYSAARWLGVGDLLTTVLPTDAVATTSKGVDWANSRAYCRSVELGVRVNLEGREPAGIVAPSEYEDVRDELIRTLSTLETPDGDPVFEWVRRREDVYDGPYADRACDVLFMPASMNHIIKTSFIGRELTPTDHTHDHKREGVFLAAGPSFENPDLDSLSLTDVAPIAMAAAGFDVPTRMTGEVPDGLLSPSVSRTNYGDVPFGTSAESTDDGSVEDRLRDLGYM